MVFRVPRMDDLESRAWLGLITVTQLLPAALDSQLQRESRLTHFEFTVLTALRFAEGQTLRMTELAEATNATLSRLSHVCTRMESRGIVERVPLPDDRRATGVTLTTQGRRELVHAMPGHIETVRSLVIDALSPAQLESLVEITQAISSRLVDPRRRSALPSLPT